MQWTNSFKYKPTTTPPNSEDRVLAGDRITDTAHCVVNATGHVGYYVAGVFTQMGTDTITLNTQNSIIIKHDSNGNGMIYLNGQPLGEVTNFPVTAITQIGNYKTALKPSVGRKPKVGLKPRAEGGVFSRPCYGEVDEYCGFTRWLSESEIIDLSQSGTISKVYSLSDYYILSAADDNLITTQEKPQELDHWCSIWNQDQRTTALPTAITSITVFGSYRALATSAHGAGVWTPTTQNTPAYEYYKAVEAWRAMLFDINVSGYLLTSQKNVVNDLTLFTPDYRTRYANLAKAEDDLRSAVMLARQDLASTEATTNAALYTESIEAQLRTQTDRAIDFYTQTTDPATGWTAEEKILHKGDYWRTATAAVWKTWNTSSWREVSDPVALEVANLAQNTADKKTTMWSTRAIANTTGVIGDTFLDSGMLYRCEVGAGSITVANSTRLTPKSWGVRANAPDNASCITNDTYFNSGTKKQMYFNGTAWVDNSNAIPTEGEVDARVAEVAPQYRGKREGSVYPTPNVGDTFLRYSATAGNTNRGVFRYTSTWTRTTENQYISQAIADIVNVTQAKPDGTPSIYGTPDDYGASFISDLFSNYIKILKGGSIIGGDRFTPQGVETNVTKDGFYFGANGILKANLQSLFRNNILIGTNAGKNLQNAVNSEFNTILGDGAVGNNVSKGFYDCTFLGSLTGYSNTVGDNNTGCGSKALYGNKVGRCNTGVGAGALLGSTSGYNTGLGYQAGSGATTEENIVSVGYYTNVDDIKQEVSPATNPKTYVYNGDYQMNFNNRIRYFEFPEGAYQKTVYDVLDQYLASPTTTYAPCLASVNSGANIGVYIRRTSATLIEIRNESNATTQSLSSTSTTPISGVLRITLVVVS